MIPVIAVDGPNASGKGTICQLLAKKFAFHLLDSGALYRLVTIAAQDTGTAFNDTQGLIHQAQQLKVDFQLRENDVSTVLNGVDVTSRIRNEEIGNCASLVAALPPVRGALLTRQRAFRQPPGLIADGRDMGTVVFPDAILKIFLTAKAEIRSLRRYNQLREQGIGVSLSAVSADLEERDRRDQERPTSPLRPAEDAVVIDTSDQSIKQVFTCISAMAKERVQRE